jgi:hypothetical protein
MPNRRQRHGVCGNKQRALPTDPGVVNFRAQCHTCQVRAAHHGAKDHTGEEREKHRGSVACRYIERGTVDKAIVIRV